ncbi:DUF4365 domain-containing protein [Acinetobacter sp. ANC 5380]|uniref:DUF4365 domain-containing protein n=1 Tax=Acinetobacter terrae TaxID=2731247 RepID=A0A7Y2WCG9_9GAMM|nr:DUF4365 domain-containing protein [Acinetobacter terrae]NNH78798.1 DUF4365 domain-containing protein [Acinetobacter terrae]
MSRYVWSKLNSMQVGTFVEYYAKMEFAMYGFQVYTSEVDDRGLDFIARYEDSDFLSIQVKSIRSNSSYVYMTKNNFKISPTQYLVLSLLVEGKIPNLYLIPATAWLEHNSLFKSYDYEGEGYKSKPEWGLNISGKTVHLLELYSFEKLIQSLVDSYDSTNATKAAESSV